jgi:hypothetical protein
MIVAVALGDISTPVNGAACPFFNGEIAAPMSISPGTGFGASGIDGVSAKDVADVKKMTMQRRNEMILFSMLPWYNMEQA